WCTQRELLLYVANGEGERVSGGEATEHVTLNVSVVEQRHPSLARSERETLPRIADGDPGARPHDSHGGAGEANTPGLNAVHRREKALVSTADPAFEATVVIQHAVGSRE